MVLKRMAPKMVRNFFLILGSFACRTSSSFGSNLMLEFYLASHLNTLNQMNPCEKSLLYIKYYDRSWQMMSKLVSKTFCDRVFAVKIWWADFKRWFLNFEAKFEDAQWLRVSANIKLKLGKLIWKVFLLHTSNMKSGRFWWETLFFLLDAKIEL